MAGEMDLRGQLALAILRLFPSSVGNDVAKRDEFRLAFGFAPDATITFNRARLSFRRSVLYPAVRILYNGSQREIAIETDDGQPATLSIEPEEKSKFFISVGDRRHQIPPLWMLAGDPKIRMAFFVDEIGNLNLPADTISAWKQKIEERALSNEEIEELFDDQRTTPQEVAAAIAAEVTKPDGQIPVLVPIEAKYYRGLVGERGGAANVEEYADGNAKAQVERLVAWDFKRGLAQCLLLCANPRLSALIDIFGRPAADIEGFFTWLANEADRFSQIAGIEVGIRALSQFPAIEPLLVKMLEEIRDEDTSSATSRSTLTANLFVFVDGELARRRSFAAEPPFWRRLAAMAQASMIERVLVSLGAADEESSEWAQLRGEQFFMQTFADLRLEPRWLPDLMNAKQLRMESLMRARLVGSEEGDKLPAGPLRSLILGKAPHQLGAITSVPSAYAPSPIEGGIVAPVAFPDELLADLKTPQGDKPLEARVFASVVNFSLVFKFDHEIAGLIVGLLRKVKYRVCLGPDADISFSLLMGLAEVAAATRHSELADEIRILARVLRRRGDVSAEPENHMRIALLACASRAGLQDWCKAVGDWLFEIANSDMDRDSAARLRSHIRRLCVSVPELWEYLSKVDAALTLAST